MDFRKLVVAYVEEGHTQKEAAKQFKLDSDTVGRWIKLKRTTGNLKVISVARSPHKLPLEALEKYAKEHPTYF